MKKLLSVSLLAFALSGAAEAGTLFDFHNDASLYTLLDNQAGPVVVTDGGLVATFTASDGIMNRTTSGFGLNSTIPSDDTDAFDVGEWIDITFDSPIILTNIRVSSWSTANGDEATLYVDGTNSATLTTSGDHAQNINVASGQVLRVASTAGTVGNGWSLYSITVQDAASIPSNSPPILDSIGDKNVLEQGALSFTIAASDPVDDDPIALSATNLPTGATFSTNGLFSWSNAVPIGAYGVTFYATDKDGSDSETITITVTERPKLLISEIADPAGTGGGDFRFVELYNSGTNSINLSADNWHLSQQANGSSWDDIPLTGTVASASAWVIAYNTTNFQNAYGFVPDQQSSGIDGTGNDAWLLYYNGTHTNGLLIDIYGELDTNGADTDWDYEDSRAVRKGSVLQPNTTWTSSDWVIVEGATTNDMQPGIRGNLPQFENLTDRAVLLERALSFNVIATDPIDGDAVTITATNLPTGATFDGTTFAWSNAVPTGIYPVTFTATDKDGSDDETVAITVLKNPLLLISEIADPDNDGGDAFRFVELYNAGTNTIDLGADGWVLSKQVNGGTSWSNIELTGTIAPAATWVIANSAADFLATYGFTPDQESSSVSGNGDDAYFLYYVGDHTDGILIDVYGELDTNGTDADWDYEDSRAVRKNHILEPNTIWTASEWTIDSGATTNNMTPGEHGPRPQFDPPLEDLFVVPGDSLTLPVTAVNTVRTDVITLSATNLPAGATFPVTIGTDTVSSTLNWNNPTVGVYTVTFAAAGLAGIQTDPVTITVSSNAQIIGQFYGWDPDTIVKLNNGQFWENVGGVGANISPALSDPDVTITKDNNSYFMYVDGDSDDSRVVPIDVAESIVSNLFTGLKRDNIYQLEDGTTWEQAGSPTISSSADPVTTWRWMDDGLQRMLFFDQNGDVIGTCRVDPAADPANPPIISEIDGYFRGWKKDRVFMLQNGQFWQQMDLALSSEARSRPDVIITYQSGDWYMSVDGAAPPAQVQVRQLFGVTRTRVDGIFQGFGLRNIIPLTNGDWWRQTSLESTASTHSSPEILLWSDDGDDFFEIPDLGQTVEAEQLAVYLVSNIANLFTGLRRGNLYQLANGENWIQATSDIINTPADTPDVMLWAEVGRTNMLVRDTDDKTIGTCTVVDPEADADGDMMSNAAEIIAGTDLEDGESTFKVTETTRDGTGHYVLHWNAIEGRVYAIDWTPSLIESFQSLETDIFWPQNSWTDTVHGVQTKGFYRINVRLAD